LTAVRIGRADDVVSNHYRLHCGADRLHNARHFMAEHYRSWKSQRAVDHLEIGMAQPAGANPHQHVACLEIRDFDRLQCERLVWSMKDSRPEFHGLLLRRLDHRAQLPRGVAVI
jgi:hypothetical protein